MNKREVLEINFCWNTRLDKRIVPKYNELFYGYVSEIFPTLIDNAILNNNDPNLAMLNALSRQNYTNPLMHYVTMLALCREVCKEHSHVKVIYDCHPIKEVLLSLLSKANVTSTIDFEYIKPLHRSFTYGRSFFLMAYKIVMQVAIKILIKHKGHHSVSMLLEQHITPGFETTDRYTKGFLDAMLSKKDIAITRVPIFSFYKPLNFMKMLIRYRKHFSSCGYLFSEKTLSIIDTLKSFKQSLVMRKMILPIIEIDGIDISSLFTYWNYHHFDISESMSVINLQIFFKKLKKTQLQFPIIMNWCENQLISKSWNKSARINFPSTTLMGMMGYNPEPFMNNLYPTASESSLKLLPDIFLCISQNARNEFRRYFERMNSVLMPAFRFQHLFDHTVKPSDMSKQALLFCGDIDVQNTIETLALLLETLSASSYVKSISCYIKLHPTMSQKYFYGIWQKELPSYASLVEGSTEEWLERCDIVLSSGSGICLESMCKGIPVIVLGNPYQLYKNTFHAQNASPLWRFAATTDAIQAALDFFYNNSPLVSEYYFKNRYEILNMNFESIHTTGFIKLIDKAFHNRHDTAQSLNAQKATEII